MSNGALLKPELFVSLQASKNGGQEAEGGNLRQSQKKISFSLHYLLNLQFVISQNKKGHLEIRAPDGPLR